MFYLNSSFENECSIGVSLVENKNRIFIRLHGVNNTTDRKDHWGM
jgi:hypothetical protein